MSEDFRVVTLPRGAELADVTTADVKGGYFLEMREVKDRKSSSEPACRTSLEMLVGGQEVED